MKSKHYIFLLFSISIFAQESIEAKFIDKTDLKLETLISVDNFGTIYYIENDVIHKKTPENTITYNNLQLGTLQSANDFNTVIILDNRLAEIFKIDFNTLSSYKDVSHMSTGHDNTIWVFNQNLQKLELFDYKSRTTRAQTVPVQNAVLDLTSNYNSCWLLTENYLYQYNYFGSMVKKIENQGYTALIESNENIFLKKENKLFFMKSNQDEILPIITPNLLINQFLVTNETLYIYDDEFLHEYQLLTN